MRGSHVAAAIAFLLTAQCLPIPQPADAAAPMTAWQVQGTEWVPINSFEDATACARAAAALAEKSGTYVGCAAGAPPDAATQVLQQQPASLDNSTSDVTEERTPQTREAATKSSQSHQGHPATSCSITGSDVGLTAVCKSY